MDVTKADWKLFQERIGEWQERYMERLNQKYIRLLSGEGHPSERFWKLEEEIRKDKKHPGVRLRLEKGTMVNDLARLLRDKVITEEDLKDFSEGTRELIERLL